MSKWLLIFNLLLALSTSACMEVPRTTDQPGPPTETGTLSPVPTRLPTETRTRSPIPTQLPTETITPSPTVEVEPSRTATPEGTLSAITGTAENTPQGRRVEIQAEDGVRLAGTFYPPESDSPPVPGVILLHMLWSERSAWEDFAVQLNEAGYAVLAMDFRGHGETGGEVDWEKAVQDVGHTWSYLKAIESVDDERLAIIGASIGANVALTAAAIEPKVGTVVLLSPGGNYAGVKTHDPMVDYGERPVLIAASEQDTYAAESSLRLAELAAGDAQLIMYPGSGHGTIMLDREADLRGLIIAWLDEHLQ